MGQGFFAPFGDRLEAADAGSLRARLAKIDFSDGRAGRRSDHVERYVLGLFLRSLLAEDRLSYPLMILKRERPDFRWQQGERVRGLEVVQAASEAHLRASSELEKEGDEPQRRWTEEILKAIRDKTESLRDYDPDLRNRCDLLVYDVTDWAGFTAWQADELPSRLAKAIQKWRQVSDHSKRLHYQSISVIREQLVLHDVSGKGRLVLHDVTGETTILVSSRAAEVLRLSHDDIADFCRRHGIRKLGFFGSIHEPERFGPESDVDVLVEFRPETRVGLIRLAGIEIELSELVGRKVDLRSVPDLSKYFRDEVTRQKTELEYVATAG